MNPDPSIAGLPDSPFHPSYLVTVGDARATYADVDHRRMQRGLAGPFTRLLDFIAATGAAGTLTVMQAYTPGTADLAGVGRALRIQHTALTADRLGALAHGAGFTFVKRAGAVIQILQRAGDLVSITAPAHPLVLAEGATAAVSVAPRALPSGVASGNGLIYTANAGTDTISEIDPATGRIRRAIKTGWGPASARTQRKPAAIP
jgi:YVTN family beta-propeller protein